MNLPLPLQYKASFNYLELFVLRVALALASSHRPFGIAPLQDGISNSVHPIRQYHIGFLVSDAGDISSNTSGHS